MEEPINKTYKNQKSGAVKIIGHLEYLSFRPKSAQNIRTPDK
jgi:hypothetical protein